MKQHINPPQFEFRVIGTEWCCRAILESESRGVVSNWYQSKAKTTAQQGAAAEILTTCNKNGNSTDPQSVVTPDSVNLHMKNSQSSESDTDPKLTLSILKKRLYIIDFGFDQLATSGPPHAPEFSISAWAKLPDESTIESSSKTGRTKKEAERKAAHEIVDLISNL